MKKWIILLILILTSATIALAAALYNKGVALETAHANIAALQDTMQTHRSVTDTLREAVSLMIFQDSVQNDSILKLDGALAAALRDRDQTLQSLQVVRVEFVKLRETIESTTVVETEIEPETDQPVDTEISQTGTFDIEGPPIRGTVAVKAWLYDLTKPWVMDTDLSVWPFDLTYGIGCDEMRRAIMNAEYPEWVSLELIRGVVEPDVCSRRKVSLFDFSLGHEGVWFGAGLGTGVLLWNLLDDGFRKAKY